MTLRIYHGSIINLNVDVIVNAANTRLQHGAGVAAAIARAAGPGFQRESNAVTFCPIGEAVATTGGWLRAKHVVHVPTMDLEPWGRIAGPEDIASGARAAIRLCLELGGKSIAFPLLGAGIAGGSRKEVARTLAGVFEEYPDLDILLCAYTGADREAVAGLGPEMAEAPGT